MIQRSGPLTPGRKQGVSTVLGSGLISALGVVSVALLTGDATAVTLLGVLGALGVAHLWTARRPPRPRPDDVETTSRFHDDYLRLAGQFEEALADYQRQVTSAERQREELNTCVRRRTADLIRTNRRLERLDRVRDEFLSLLAHELRTPLTSIRSYLEVAINQTSIPHDRQQDLLRNCRRLVQRLAKLINDLIHVSQLRAGRYEFRIVAVNPRDVLDEVIEAQRTSIQSRGLRLCVALQENTGAVSTDRDAFSRILEGVVTNAIQHGPDGSEITIEAARVGEHVEIAVEDQGSGVSPEDHEMIFEPFFKTRSVGQSTREGTGLGLFLCRELAQRMEADLRLDAASKGGARFIVSLPCARRSGEPKTPPATERGVPTYPSSTRG